MNYPSVPENAVFEHGGELKTNSRKVAAAFGLQHSHVLRDIRKIIAQVPENFSQSIFGLAEYRDKQGKIRIMYEMTKDGFMLLIMGYTSREAMRIKVAYIQAFESMRMKLDGLNRTLIVKLLSALEAEKQSFAAASLAGKIMRRRQEEKPLLAAKIDEYQAQIQPLLADFDAA